MRAPLPWDTTYQLLRFCWQNSPLRLPMPDPTVPCDVADAEMRAVLMFVGRCAQGDVTLPRTLAAHQLLALVPNEYGVALFGVTG